MGDLVQRLRLIQKDGARGLGLEWFRQQAGEAADRIEALESAMRACQFIADEQGRARIEALEAALREIVNCEELACIGDLIENGRRALSEGTEETSVEGKT